MFLLLHYSHCSSLFLLSVFIALLIQFFLHTPSIERFDWVWTGATQIYLGSQMTFKVNKQHHRSKCFSKYDLYTCFSTPKKQINHIKFYVYNCKQSYSSSWYQ